MNCSSSWRSCVGIAGVPAKYTAQYSGEDFRRSSNSGNDFSGCHRLSHWQILQNSPCPCTLKTLLSEPRRMLSFYLGSRSGGPSTCTIAINLKREGWFPAAVSGGPSVSQTLRKGSNLGNDGSPVTRIETGVWSRDQVGPPNSTIDANSSDCEVRGAFSKSSLLTWKRFKSSFRRESKPSRAAVYTDVVVAGAGGGG